MIRFDAMLQYIQRTSLMEALIFYYYIVFIILARILLNTFSLRNIITEQILVKYKNIKWQDDPFLTCNTPNFQHCLFLLIAFITVLQSIWLLICHHGWKPSWFMTQQSHSIAAYVGSISLSSPDLVCSLMP